MLDSFLGGLGSIAQTGIQFGANYGAALLSADIQRDLRRTVYQDQMHSMRKAGLNPILAAGATPQMGSSGGVDAPNVSNAVDTSLRASKNSDERALLRSQSTAAEAAARKAQAEADTAEMNRDAQRTALEAKADSDQANADFTRGPRSTNTVADTRLKDTKRYETKADILLKRQRWEADLPVSERDRNRAAVIRDESIAGLTNAREAGELNRNVRTQAEADYIRDYLGLVRGGMAARDAEAIMGVPTKAVKDVLSALTPAGAAGRVMSRPRPRR